MGLVESSSLTGASIALSLRCQRCLTFNQGNLLRVRLAGLPWIPVLLPHRLIFPKRSRAGEQSHSVRRCRARRRKRTRGRPSRRGRLLLLILAVKCSRGRLGNVRLLYSCTWPSLTWPAADPNLAPTPPSHEPTLLVPDSTSPGLFGPRSPRDSRHY
jgi:hypothetical protein